MRIPDGAFVRAAGTELVVNGNTFAFVGANFDGIHGNDQRRRLDDVLDAMAEDGITVGRQWVVGEHAAGSCHRGLEPYLFRCGPDGFLEESYQQLDRLLARSREHGIRVILTLSNQWGDYGGIPVYLRWAGLPTDERSSEAFYSDRRIQAFFRAGLDRLLDRVNSITGCRYIDDPTIMAWEVANEPRPMRPTANDAYVKWLAATTAAIKAIDKNHLVTLGHEGWIGTEDIKLFETVHADANVGYLTIHIWPKNWGWFENGKMAAGFDSAVDKTERYVDDNAAVAVKLNKPLVIEEFGLPRDDQSFDVNSPTTLRDRYFGKILSRIGRQNIAGANFWAFGGTARPIKGQLFWKPGDDRMGDPPMEEQGLNSIFDRDTSTWKTILTASKAVKEVK